MNRKTEADSHYRHLEQMSIKEILYSINKEDQKVADAVRLALPAIGTFISRALKRVGQGGRVFYIGAGTSGRLGILDASECPPTFGVDHHTIIGLIAGGDGAIRKAVEFAEDDGDGAWRDMAVYCPEPEDVVLGLAASGTTPYVIGGVEKSREEGLLTGCITCNAGSPLEQAVECPIVVEVGPEFVTGSTRMKSGTAQKMVLNMISTALMVKMGRVKDNKMVDMHLSNNKLLDRGVRMIVEKTGWDYETARVWLARFGNVREALDACK